MSFPEAEFSHISDDGKLAFFQDQVTGEPFTLGLSALKTRIINGALMDPEPLDSEIQEDNDALVALCKSLDVSIDNTRVEIDRVVELRKFLKYLRENGLLSDWFSIDKDQNKDCVIVDKFINPPEHYNPYDDLYGEAHDRP
jgi:hypothetical protein